MNYLLIGVVIIVASLLTYLDKFDTPVGVICGLVIGFCLNDERS